ncbi:MAG TPA: hypothetical protein DIW20_02610 [Rhodospirillaceae bacterium]|nr:hypothetical protein [Rhodospirillaceae bacterium]
MTPQTTPDITPPPFLTEGATIHFTGDSEDWRVKGADRHAWQVEAIKTDQRRHDEAPKLYVTLRSIGRMEGLAFMTVPYDADTMQVTPVPPKPQIVFPAAGSEVFIRESDDPAHPHPRDGLWEVSKSFNKVAEDGREKLHLSLKSVGRKNVAFLNVAFNPATMKPVMPAYMEDAAWHATAQRDVGVFKMASIKKRNAAP